MCVGHSCELALLCTGSEANFVVYLSGQLLTSDPIVIRVEGGVAVIPTGIVTGLCGGTGLKIAALIRRTAVAWPRRGGDSGSHGLCEESDRGDELPGGWSG